MASLRKRARLSLAEDNDILPTTEDNDILVDDVLVKIIKNVSISQWCRLELVSKQFKRCVEKAYHSLVSLNLKSVVLPKFGNYSKNRGNLRQCLLKLVRCCPSLQSISGLDCLCNNVTFAELKLLQNLTNLQHITFDNCRVNVGVLSKFLKNVPLMKSLEIGDCELWHDSFKSVSANDPVIRNAVFFDFFGKFESLMELTIIGVGARFSGNFLSLVNADSLKVLDFNESKFDGAFVAALLNRCVNLEALSLFDPLTGVSENTGGLELEVLQCLPNLLKLRKFSVNVDESYTDDHVTNYEWEDLLNVLVKCKSLRDIRLQFHEFPIVTDDFLGGLIAQCPLLEALNLDISQCESKEIVSKIADLQNLTSLSIEHEYPDGVLEYLFSNLYKLSSLSRLSIVVYIVKEAELMSLNNLQCLTSFTFEHYGDRFVLSLRVVQKWIESGFLQKLTTLQLCCPISHSTVKAIVENVPLLEIFCFRSTINGKTLLSIAENCKRLKKLNIRRCGGISDKALLKFLSECKSLKCLIVYRSDNEDLPENVLFESYKHLIWRNEKDCFFE